ncbi:MAG: carboxymuconolactone decarboxylase family protein [Deltaproteobacteria bacterium]|nr:carboxymuconolactone decarboxylase family protein [Deltaproteobacteria bacterium]
MENMHEIYTRFKDEFPEVHARHEALGKEIHENTGPLTEKSRWLIKIAISAACNHKRALATHIKKAQAAGVNDDEIKQTLLLLIPTAGFPMFMKAFSVLNNVVE